MRILLAAKHLHYPQGGGGLERNTHELCLRLLKLGVTPAVMCNLQPLRSMLVLKNQIARKLRPAFRFPMDDKLGYPVFRGWGNEDGAKEVVARFKPDIVIAQSAEPVPLLQSFEGMGIPRMAYFHEVLRPWDVDTLLAMGDVGLLANSEFTASVMAQRAGFRPAVIVPLVDPTFYRTQTAPRNVLFVNTHLRKGVEVAFRLAELRPDVPFDFIRSWVSVHEPANLVERARAAGNITLHPPTNDMRQFYARARLVLAPSQVEEAWGRVATEAHINGIPVLASDRGGLPEAVGPGGRLVAHDAPAEAWSEAFSSLWDDPAAYAACAAAARDYSKRTAIQPEAIVEYFAATVADFLARSRLKRT